MSSVNRTLIDRRQVMADEMGNEQQDLVPEEWLKAEQAEQAAILDEGDPDRIMADGPVLVTPKEEPAPAPEPKQEEKVVPLAALHEERTKRQERDAELTQQKALNLRLMEMLEKPAPTEPTEPEFYDDDPVTVGTLKKLVPTLVTPGPQSINPVAIGAAVRMVMLEEKARESYPDYDEVVESFRPFLLSKDAQDAMVARAQSSGKSIFEVAYTMAKQWREPDATPSPQTPDIPKGTLKLQNEKVENQKRQPATATGGAGSAPAEALTIEALLSLPADDFKAVWNGLKPAQQRKLSGG